MQPYPLEFRPILKQTIWGGRRLGKQLGKPIGEDSDYAESWELVDHGEDQSVVTDGQLAGQTLAAVKSEHREWLVGDCDSARFPLLLKYLDCNRVLSVQVHPDDRYGLGMPVPDLGKTEAWYIVATEPGSRLYAGLKEGVDRGALEAAARSGNTESVLHSFEPVPGDVVFIPAGTVHALGAGLLVAEIQQSSDTTFRLHDWNRVGADGKPRELHLDQALDVTDYASGPVSPRRSKPSISGWQSVVECEKFVLRVLDSGSDVLAGDHKFHIVTVPRGTAEMQLGEETRSLRTGQSMLLPAALDRVEIRVGQKASVLEMHLPG